MTWDYDPGDLDPTTASGRKNIVRILVGDTDDSQQQKTRRLEDEEIAFYLTRWSNAIYPAALEAGEALLSRLSRQEIGTTSNVQGQRWDALTKVVERIRRWVRLGAAFEATGLAVQEHVDQANDTTLVQPSFARDQFDNPNASQPDDPGVLPSLLGDDE